MSLVAGILLMGVGPDILNFVSAEYSDLGEIMSGGGTQQSLRKALGAIKDSTRVGLAKVNSDYKV